VEVVPLVFNTSVGQVRLNIWDCGGQEKFKGLETGYYVGADGVLIMYDVSSRLSYKNTQVWYNKFIGTVVENRTPIILIGNKVDIDKRKVDINEVVANIKEVTFEVSAKDEINCRTPFLYLIQKLMKDPSINFV